MMIMRYLVGWVAILILMAAQPVAAQKGYTGVWHKVSLYHSSSQFQDLATTQINDFGFMDSTSGIAWLGLSTTSIFTTLDGGHSWTLDTTLAHPYTKLGIDAVDVTGAERGFICSGNTQVISPGNDSSISSFAMNQYGELLPYFPIAEKMVDSLHGFRWTQAQDYHGDFIDSACFLVTYDGWQTATNYGLAFPVVAPQSIFSTSPNLWGGELLDSSEVWSVDSSEIIHTTDAGERWETFFPVDTSIAKPQWYSFFAYPSQQSIYAEAGLNGTGPVDFTYSTDNGGSWQLDSTFGPRLWRIAVPEPGIIWAMIGNRGRSGYSIEPYVLLGNQRDSNELCNKIGYSSDNGKTWFIDSVTFAGDTLEEMHFTDPHHGWIAGYANNDAHIWYYDDEQSSVDAATQTGPTISLPHLVMYPDPAETTVATSNSTLHLTIVDPLGRSYNCSQRNDNVDISNLPPGIYLVSDGYISGKFIKE